MIKILLHLFFVVLGLSLIIRNKQLGRELKDYTESHWGGNYTDTPFRMLHIVTGTGMVIIALLAILR